jgi:hypothetical protein
MGATIGTASGQTVSWIMKVIIARANPNGIFSFLKVAMGHQ